MYLKNLRINGFKSFADATQIALEPGVTTVVGPNGCGKSNIADAIRWVLGEQSAKSLRAGLMQDVIFQGAETRKPVNLCEVSLLFSDCESELGTAYNEVEITRRVSRDGASDYHLNGKSCRLKDINSLFLDTGIGRVSYSFMVQGQIDQILSTNPAERRTIFEEAAGISKYKAQRREALNKLNLVDTNLARVTDVMEELSRQIGSLRRQAGKALRFQRIKKRLTHLDLALNASKFSELSETVDSVEEEAVTLRKQSVALTKILNGREEGLNAKREDRSVLYESLRSSQQTVFDLRSEKEQAENKGEFSEIRSRDLSERIADLKVEISALGKQKDTLVEQAEGDSRDKEKQLSVVGNSDEVFKERSEQLDVVQRQISEAASELQQQRQDILVTESKVTRLRSECTTLEIEQKTYQVRHSKISEEIFVSKNDCIELVKGLKAIQGALKTRLKDKEKEEAGLQKLQKDLGTLKEEFRSLQTDIQEVDRKLAQETAQLSILEELKEKLEGFSDGAKAILRGELKETLEKDSFRVLTKNLLIESGYTKAMIGLLGSAVDTIILDDPDRLISVTDQLEARKLGRVCLQVEAPPRTFSSRKDHPESLRRAEDVVGTNEPKLERLLSNLLSDCYFCETLADFLEFWRENPTFEFLFVATRNGELVDRRGLIYGGHKRGESGTYLERESEIKTLRRNNAENEQKLTNLRKKDDKLLVRLDKAENDLEVKRKTILEIAQELSTARGQELVAKENLEQNKRRMAEGEKELSALEKSKEKSEKSLTDSQGQLQDAESELEQYKLGVGEIEKKLEKFREEREINRDKVSDVRIELAEKRQQLENIDRGLGEIERQTAELDQLILKRNQEVDTLHEQIEGLEEESKEQKKRAAEIEKTLKVTSETLERDRTRLLDTEREIKELEESLATQREEHHNVESELNRHEVQLARQSSELNFLIEEVRREYDVDLKSIDWKRELWLAGDRLVERVKLDMDSESSFEEAEEDDRGEPDEADLKGLENTRWEDVSKEVELLRERISSMGPVNLIAIQEYKELKERHEFLKAQSDDLWNSKEQLLSAIDEINRTSEQLFKDTFDKVRENFAYTFDTLFGGGKSDLVLIDSEDLLESGIDIIARPPGTRLKNLALLSGGQKTMTAVALLFAIYMVKPSPFCMLDELDAPLDDANIGRFVKMLLQFTKYSQFVIITHNKRTIASSTSIFGVTMQEKGVSKMVSMRFNRASGKPEELAEVPG